MTIGIIEYFSVFFNHIQYHAKKSKFQNFANKTANTKNMTVILNLKSAVFHEKTALRIHIKNDRPTKGGAVAGGQRWNQMDHAKRKNRQTYGRA